MKATGEIKTFSPYGMLIEHADGSEEWYNRGPTKSDTQGYNSGQTVEVEYETNTKNGRTFRNVQNVKLVGGSTASNKATSISRSVALKAAVEHSKSNVETIASVDDVLKVASEFEKYLSEGYTENEVKEEFIR